MTGTGTVLLLAGDAQVAQHVSGALDGLAAVRVSLDRASFEKALDALDGDAVVIVDLCADGGLAWLTAAPRQRPLCVAVALGDPRGARVREAMDAGVYAVEPLDFELRAFRQTVAHALDRRALRRSLMRIPQTAVSPPRIAPPSAATESAVRRFIRAMRPAESVDAVLRQATDSVVLATGVASAGIFAADPAGTFRLQADTGCTHDVRGLSFGPGDPVVRWLERHGQLVARAGLDRVGEPAEQLFLREVLSALGAEVVLPLRARGRLLGWLFTGRRTTGLPLCEDDLEDLAAMAGHIALALETASVLRDTALQSSLAGTVFAAMPTGVIATDADGVVRWFNRAAGDLLGLAPETVIGRPADSVGSRAYDRLHAALSGEEAPAPVEWFEMGTRRAISATVRRLSGRDGVLGAVLFLEDVTARRRLAEKEERLARETFWVDLAAGLSHEIRNPLVAIKTFAQLLPQRFGDAEFRNEFSVLVTREIARLEVIVDQINRFAYPPSTKHRRLTPHQIISGALLRYQARWPAKDPRLQVADALDVEVMGDLEALSEAIGGLMDNAREALGDRPDGRLQVAARGCLGPDGNDEVGFTIRDNGPGIPLEIRDRVLSPFVTTKVHGMGLGLPIARSVAESHGGRLTLETDGNGTTVTLFIPAARRAHAPDAQRRPADADFTPPAKSASAPRSPPPASA